MASIGELIKKFDTDAIEVLNFDKTGMSSGQDFYGGSAKKAVTSKGLRCSTIGADLNKT